MRNFFNVLFYEKKKILFPVVIVSVMVGVILDKLICNLHYSLFTFLVLLTLINVIVLISDTYYKTYDELAKNKAVKPIYFGINLICFEIFIYINYNEVKELFKEIKLSYLPTDIYIIILLTGSFLIFLWILYMVMFSNIKTAKITTQGLEVEVDDTLLTVRQNQILNNLQTSIRRVMKVNGEMNKLVAQFILQELIDYNGEVKEDYNYKILFSALRDFSNKMFNKEGSAVIVDFKGINTLSEIKEDYKIPNNLYNKIYSRIENLPEGKNDVFSERNLVFINYKFQSIEHDELRKNRIIGIIEFKEIEVGYTDYGSLLIISLKMFDSICALTLTSF